MDAGCAAPALNRNSIPRPGSVLYRVVGMLFVPLHDQIIARLADILGIDDVAPKSPLRVHRPRDAPVRLDVDLVLAVQADEYALSSPPDNPRLAG